MRGQEQEMQYSRGIGTGQINRHHHCRHQVHRRPFLKSFQGSYDSMHAHLSKLPGECQQGHLGVIDGGNAYHKHSDDANKHSDPADLLHALSARGACATATHDARATDVPPLKGTQSEDELGKAEQA